MTPLVRYSGAVLVPVAIGVLTGLWVTASAFERLQREADLRIAASATDLIQQEMGTARDALLEEAEAVQPTRHCAPAVEAALRGDTVLALGSSEESLELTVAYGEGPLVRVATGPFRPTVLELLPSIAGYRLALYLRGRGTVPTFSPEVLHPEVLLALARQAEGMALELDGVAVALRAFQTIPGRPSDVAVLAAAEDDTSIEAAGMTAPVTVLMVILLLSGFAAWTTYNPRRPSVSVAEPVEQSTLQWSLVVLVPVIAGVAIVLSLDRDYRQSAAASMQDQLNRAIILVKQVDRISSVSAARAITGFDAARLRASEVEAATRDDVELISALEELRPPPPSFTSSGVTDVDGDTRFYSAARTPGGATLVLIGPTMTRRLRDVRRSLGLGGLLILLPPLLFLWLSEPPGSESASEGPDDEPPTGDRA